MTRDPCLDHHVVAFGGDRKAIEEVGSTLGPGFVCGDGGDGAGWSDAGAPAPDLVLIDAASPAAFELCASIRASPAWGDVPILVIAPDDPESIARAYGAGATDWVSRPLNGPTLQNRARIAIGLRRTAEALRTNTRRFRTAERLGGIGHWAKDIPGDAIACSEHVAAILGVPPDATPATLEALIAFVPDEERTKLGGLLARAGVEHEPFRFEHGIRRPDATRISVSHDVDMVRDDRGRVIGLVGALQDVTDRRRAEQRIHELAYIDPVTDLPNRLYLLEHLRHAMETAGGDGSRVAVLFIDLDDFKQVNDALGHDAGDELLRRVARRLMANTRSVDGIVRWQPPKDRHEIDLAGQLVTRIGGDEFVIVQQGLQSADDALALGRRIAGILSKPFVISGRTAHVSASIGISVSPDHGRDVDRVLKSADAAMYHAKERRLGVRMFDDAIDQRTTQRIVVGVDLRKAIENREIFLKYQPRVELRSRRVSAVEALARWRHPVKGIILPKDFIEVAEETGLIDPLTELVFEQACAQVLAWRKQGHAFLVSVNISARQFRRTDLAEMLEACVRRGGVPPEAIEIEITEGALMKDVEATAAVLEQLRSLGFSLSIDDFGTGYSSLHRLKKLPVAALKLDRSFVGEMLADADADSTLRTLIGLGKSLGLRTIGEGVENERQAAQLLEYGCDEAQGYHISRALAPENLDSWLRAYLTESPSRPAPSASR